MNLKDVVEVRVNWERVAASPWAGCRLVSRVRSADGQEHVVTSGEALGVLDALRAAGARLVEGVEGVGRVVRVTSVERRTTSGEAGGTPALLARPATLEGAVGEMIAKGAASQPKLKKRLEAAGELVRGGRVELVDEEEARIGPYVISAEGCTCGDFRHRGGWCKHRLAVRMGRHLARHGFALPVARTETTPLISDENRALIESGRVMDEAFRRSSYGAERRALASAANGRSIAAADWQRLHGGKQ